MAETARDRLVIVNGRGTLSGIYPTLIAGTTGVAHGEEIRLYVTFGGSSLIARAGNPAIPPEV